MKINYNRGGIFQSFDANRQRYEENLKSSASFKQENDIFIKQKKRETKKAIAKAALFGAIAPVVFANVLKGRGKILTDTMKNSASALKDKAKAVYNMFEIESYTDMLLSTTGAIVGGTAAGIIKDKNPENREEKYREGIFEFLNNMTPTTLVAIGETYSQKTGKFTSAPAKAALIAGSVAGGMFIANKTSNKINEKLFDKNNSEHKKHHKRNFKPTDCLVHMDDILGLLVLAKIPLAKKMQADKFLPLLYAKAGFEAGDARCAKPDSKKCDRI